ncbi:hypothetical protein HYU11_01005 [Candidatus Woesearchaeota archaeon]|nr:hypothetical protein [Candidatus Woesearchaeota archaeon]
MNDKRVYVLLLVLVVFLAGCTRTTPANSGTPFCGGIDGIEMKFVEGSPPQEVFDNSQFPFDMTLRLFNKGEHNVLPGEAKIELSGISSIDFGGPPYTKIIAEPITGKHKDQNGNCVDGDPILVTFGGPGEEAFKYKHSLPGNTKFSLRADLCYSYSTNSTVQFCIQRELPRFNQEPTCKVTDTKPVSNSGAPLHIENFKQSPGGEYKIAFSFDVVRKGTGAVHSGTLCDSSFQARNKVHVKVFSRVGAISCTSLRGGNEGDILLTDNDKSSKTLNRRNMNCILDTTGIRGEREFETPVNIELSYNYKQHEDIDILVKHLG